MTAKYAPAEFSSSELLMTRARPRLDLSVRRRRGRAGYLHTGFHHADEERRLLLAIRDVPMHDAQYYGYTAKRRVASFGASYDFESRQLHDAAPVPGFLLPLRRRLSEVVSVPDDSFVQTLITNTDPAHPWAGIATH